jgi:hypothetical protein
MPEKPDDPRLAEMLRRNRNEYDAIINGIGLVTRAWATVEDGLFGLFRTLGGFSEADRYVAGVIFYTPSNTETRVSFVDKLVSYRFELNKVVGVDPRLSEIWTKVKGKIDALKNTRNAIVHGTISHSSRGADLYDQRPRLTPAQGDWLRFLPPILAGRHPGLGSNELKVHEQAVWRLNDRVRKLNEVFALGLKAQTGHDPEVRRTLLELLSQLEAQTNTQNNQDQEPPDKSDPDQSPQG